MRILNRSFNLTRYWCRVLSLGLLALTPIILIAVTACGEDRHDINEAMDDALVKMEYSYEYSEDVLASEALPDTPNAFYQHGNGDLTHADRYAVVRLTSNLCRDLDAQPPHDGVGFNFDVADDWEYYALVSPNGMKVLQNTGFTILTRDAVEAECAEREKDQSLES